MRLSIAPDIFIFIKCGQYTFLNAETTPIIPAAPMT